MSDTRAVTLERSYPASPEQIWQAWTDPDVLSRWYGCDPGQLWAIHTWDAVPGGALHVSMDFEAGPFEVRGTFLDVERPELLRYTFGEGQTITVVIAALGATSSVTVRHDGLPTDDMCDIVTAGWTSSLAHLPEVASAVSLG